MFNVQRGQKVLSNLKKNDLHQSLISDPYAVYYLCGKWIFPGERFLGLILKEDARPVLVLNELFRFEEEIGVTKVYFKDGDDLTALLRPYLNENETLGVDKNLPARFLLPLIDAKAASAFVNASFAVDDARAIKDEEEKEKMRRASLVNDQAMERFTKLVKEGISEIEIADQMLGIYKELGASAYSFEPIVAFGKNAADPHHMPDDTKLRVGDAVLFDVGCIVDDYCSDMTRTFFFKEGPKPEAERIYELVRKANESAEAFCAPGRKIAEIDKTARDIITEGGYGKDFTHRLGHFIGIETHEAGDVSQANPRTAEAGNTFSIEPGIYSLEEGVGVRIEDLVLITEDGVEILNHYPHDLRVIG
ncbi:MAG: aminopeptidase P family protein [Erysipelotrichaceae bacterium]|nr:aminopeptidase P family protein [Erysipelotrichaceae bacterium]